MEINPTYVTFEQAKLLKEKGLNKNELEIECNQGYDFRGGDIQHHGRHIDSHMFYSALEQWQVVEWLRVKHGIIIELLVDGWKDDNCVSEEFLCYRIFIWQIGKPKPHHNDDLGAPSTPQEAYSVAFDYILKELI